MKRYLPLIAAAAIAAVPAGSQAADPRYPDWPCAQVRVVRLSPGAVWTGPSIDDVGDSWRKDPRITDLVTKLATRRTPLAEAEELAGAFVAREEGDKQATATLLFAGLFATLDSQRAEIVDGLERLTRRQRDFARTIEADAARLRALQREPDPDEGKIRELTQQVNWGTRIFEERRKTVRYACEVPVLIEKRLFVLARAIQAELG